MRKLFLITLIAFAVLATVSAKKKNRQKSEQESSSGSQESGEKHIKNPNFAKHWRKHRKGERFTKKEVESRERIFIKNKKHQEEWNARNDVTYKLGSSPFDDFKDDEIQALGVSDINEITPRALPAPHNSFKLSVAPPASVDWRRFSSPVANQGKCGSCWAYSAVAALEAFYRHQGITPTLLSQQYFISCDTTNNGCVNGSPFRALKKVEADGYMTPTLASYPPTSYLSNQKEVCKTTGFERVSTPFMKVNYIEPKGNITYMKQLLNSFGTAVIAVQFFGCPNFMNYKSGIYVDTCGCNSDCSAAVNWHWMTLEGYGKDAATGQDYWLIKNSYGTGWGENGYMRMAMDPTNKCCVACRSIFPEKA